MSYFTSKKIWFWGFIILLILNISAVSTMFYHGKEMRARHEKSGFQFRHKSSSSDYFTKKLGLDANQQKSVESIHKDHRSQVKLFRKLIGEKELEVFNLAKQGGDSADFQTALAELSHLKKDVSLNSIAFYKEIKGVCTPEQYTDLDRLFERFINMRTKGGSMGPEKPEGRQRAKNKRKHNKCNNQ